MKQSCVLRVIAILCVVLVATSLTGCGSGGSKAEKMAKIAVWEDEGWTANGELTKLMFDGDADVRARAVLAIARVNDTLTIDSVRLVYLNDSEPRVRALAAFAYGAGLWRSGGSHILESLERDENPLVITETLQAFGRLYLRDDHERLLPFFRHDDPAVRAQAIHTLDLINRRDDHVDLLISLLDDPDPGVRSSALSVLGRVKNDDACNAALPFAKDTSDQMRRLAYRVIGHSPDPAMRDTVLVGLRDAMPLVRAAAAEALALHIDTITIVKAFPYLDSEQHPLVLMNLINAIAEHWREAAEPYLRRLIGHEDPGVRAKAVRAAVRRLDMNFVDVIAPAIHDPDPFVRISYCEAIDGITQFFQLDASGFIDELDTLTFDPVPRVRARALQTYLSHPTPDGLETISRFLHDSSMQCQQMAIKLIGSLRLQLYQDTLYEMYSTVMDMWRPEIKWAIAAASANMAPSVVADPVRSELFMWGIDDPNRLVRWYSIAVWEKFREDFRDRLGMYKTDLTVENVDELLHPYSSNPRANLNTTRGTVVLELDAEGSPRAVRQFISLAEGGYYDACPMNDVQPGYIVQTGDRETGGWGLPDETVRDELHPERMQAGDVIWLINSRDSGHGEFGLILSRTPYLDWRYGRFARIVEGLDIARSLTFSDTVLTVDIVLPDAS